MCRRSCLVLSPCLALAILAVPVYAATLNVPADYATIQGAINAAVDGDVVLVQPGTYFENINFVGKAITVASAEGPEVTTIDGNQMGSVVTFASGEGLDSLITGFTIMNGSGTCVGNYWRGGGIFCVGASPRIVENIVRQNYLVVSAACDSSYERYNGAGIYCEASSAEIDSNLITQNEAYSGYGMGICCLGGSPIIRNNIMSANKNSDSGLDIALEGSAGGGLYCDCETVEIVDNQFIGNRSGSGGGVFLLGPGVVTENLFQDNTAPYTFANYGGGGAYVAGPALICRNQFVGNFGQAWAGGLRAINCTLVDNVFRDNLASFRFGYGQGGGGAFLGDCLVLSCRFSGNVAHQQGGGARAQNTTFVNCIFSENHAINTVSGSGGGGGVFSNCDLSACTFFGNVAGSAGGFGWGGAFAGTGTITNSVLFGNTATTTFPGVDEIDAWGGGVTVTRSLVAGGWPGTGNIDADPLFVDAANGDFRLLLGSPCIDAGDNGAIPADTFDLDDDGDTLEPLPFDIAGVPRLLDTYTVPDTGIGSAPIVDMGAHEFAQDCDGDGIPEYQEFIDGTVADCNASGVPDACEIAIGASPDLNENLVPDECDVHFRRGECNDIGAIDLADAIYLLNYIFNGAAAPHCLDACDMNDDGHVNLADSVFILVALFEGGAPPAEPYLACGVDVGADAVECEDYSGCP